MNHNTPITSRRNSFITKLSSRFPDLLPDKMVYVNTYTPVTLICRKHGDFTYVPKELFLPSVKVGCPECRAAVKIANHNKQRSSNETFVSRAKQVHGDVYDYSLVQYVSAHNKVAILCNVHGVFEQTSVNHITHKQGCPQCKAVSKGEQEIIKALQCCDVEYVKEFKVNINGSQRRFDFCIPSTKTLIEFDGKQHWSFSEKFHKTISVFEQQQLWDVIKQQWAEDNGYILVRFNKLRTVYNDTLALVS